MRATIRRKVLSAVVISIVAAASYAAGFAQGKPPINKPIANIKFEPYGPGTPLQVAMLWGDRNKPGEYGMLLKFPAGFESGRHSHTADYHGVAVEGVWVHENDGNPSAPRFSPGSYVMQPGKQIHNDICRGPAECIVFIHQHAQGDFIPAK